MKVSIITSCFNREATIAHAIESVLAQDYPDIEYIVVDGASRDRSLQVIERYSDRITRIISEPDSGMYEGINKGIRVATGDIVGLLHSDDFLYATDIISRIVRRFEETGADGLWRGHAPNYTEVFAPGAQFHNVIKDVKITGIHQDGLLGAVTETGGTP